MEVLFPFGHGLSYTKFGYADLELPALVRIGEPVPISFTVANIGDRAGAEVAQVYVRDPVCSLPRPLRELKGIAKIWLQPGESRRVNIEIRPRDLAFYDPAKQQWIVEPGEFEIMIGASSRDIRLTKTIEVQS